MKTKSLINAAMMMAIYLVFFTLYIRGILPNAISILLPLPLIVYTSMNKKISDSFLLFIGCSVGAYFIGSIFGLMITAIYGLVGVIIGISFAQKRPTWQRVLNGAIVYAIGLPLMTFLMTGMSLTDVVHEGLTMQLEMIQSMVSDESLVENIVQNHEVMRAIFPSIMPTMLLLIGMILAALNDWIARTILKRLQFEIPYSGKLRDFQLGRLLAFVYVLSQIGAVLITNASLNMVLLNVILLLNLLFTLQGVVVLLSFFKTRRKKGLGIILLILVFSTNLSRLFSLFGVLDTLFNYRDRFKNDV